MTGAGQAVSISAAAPGLAGQAQSHWAHVLQGLGSPVMPPVPQCCPLLCCPVVPVFWRGSSPEALVCPSVPQQGHWGHRAQGDGKHRQCHDPSSASAPVLMQEWQGHGERSPASVLP